MEWALLIAVMVIMLLWEIRAFVRGGRTRLAAAEERVQLIASDANLTGALGDPVRRSGPPTGSVDRTRDGLRALLAIPVAQGTGTLYVNALRTKSRWSLASSNLHVERRSIEVRPLYLNV